MKLEKKRATDPNLPKSRVAFFFFLFTKKKKKKKKKEIPTDRPDLKICALEGNTTYFFLA